MEAAHGWLTDHINTSAAAALPARSLLEQEVAKDVKKGGRSEVILYSQVDVRATKAIND